MKRRTGFLASWTVVNVFWWFISIFVSITLGVDVNPLLGNLGEIILNLAVYNAGLFLIYHKVEEEDKR